MIHKYSMHDINIVLDVESGSIHIFDELAFNLIDFCENKDKALSTDKALNSDMAKKYSTEDINNAIDEIFTLIDDNCLFTDKPNDLDLVMKNKKPVVKALCLHIAHDCNLSCKYCFAEEGEYHGSRSFMSAEVGKKALDFLVANSGNRRNLEVDFFGGEPLMNFDVVKEIVEYGRSIEKQNNKLFRFTLTTNGVLLNDEVIDYVNENMSNVVLSLDGRKEVNDNMRRTLNGKSSYDIILPNFKNLVVKRGHERYYVRGTFTRNNLDFKDDVIHMFEQGFKEISIEPVVASPDMPYSLRKEDVQKICDEYEALAKEMLEMKKNGKEFNFFHFMIDLSGGPCVAKRVTGCGAGTEYLAVTPTGDLFPCHQFVGNDEYKMGTLLTGVTNTSKRDDFDKCNVLTKPECSDCFAKYYCSGGCAANALQFSGNILDPYEIGCDLQKKRIECAIMMKAHEALN